MPFAKVPAELRCGFCDDLYHPKSEKMLSLFTAEEREGLAQLYGLLCEASSIETDSVGGLLKQVKTGKMAGPCGSSKGTLGYYERHA